MMRSQGSLWHCHSSSNMSLPQCNPHDMGYSPLRHAKVRTVTHNLERLVDSPIQSPIIPSLKSPLTPMNMCSCGRVDCIVIIGNGREIKY